MFNFFKPKKTARMLEDYRKHLAVFRKMAINKGLGEDPENWTDLLKEGYRLYSQDLSDAELKSIGFKALRS